MTKQTLNNGSAANDGTGDTLRQGATKIQANFDELYAILGGDALSSKVSLDSATKGIIFEGSSIDNNQTFLVPTDPSADRTITLPDASGNVVLDTSTNTLTNKTLTNPILSPTATTAGKIEFLEGTNNGTNKATLIGPASTADVTITLPATTDTLVARTTTDTLTNKTLTSPAITSPSITTSINDANGAEVIEVPATANADNHLKITNADGASPTIESVGANSNVGLNIGSKGTGVVTIKNGFAFGDGIEQGTGGAITLLTPTTVFNIGTNFAANLPDGTVQGQIKILINKDTGIGTITPTTTGNFGFGTQISLSENQTATLIWDGDDWQLISTHGGTVA
jgi:hypothetical protein